MKTRLHCVPVLFRLRWAGAVVLAGMAANAAEGADIRGYITNLTPGTGGTMLGSALIEGSKETDTSMDKAVAQLTAQTRIFKWEAGKQMPATYADLKAGQKVEATFSGPMLMSYPARGGVTEVVILPATWEMLTEPVTVNAPLNVVGLLQGPMMGMGGETSGWNLFYMGPQGSKVLEVDLSAVKGFTPVGGTLVRVKGTVAAKEYLERGTVLVLKAASVAKESGAAASPATTAPANSSTANASVKSPPATVSPTPNAPAKP